jgi:methylated-DNA-[protein]-cysteine S-methyltransferase
MSRNDTVARCSVETPIGTLVLTATGHGLSRVDLAGNGRRLDLQPSDGSASQHLEIAKRAFEAYFAGTREAFVDITLVPEGTPFQQAVWRGLRTIPYGETISYRTLAERVGKPSAVRAVGLANGRNPLPIVVPCHRVVGADGTLTGFGLGIRVKAWLLVHEGAAAPFRTRITPGTHITPPAGTLF